MLSTPHHLIVRVKAEHFKALIVVTHAPVQDVEDTVYQAHRDAIAKAIMPYDPSWPLFLLADAIGIHQGQDDTPLERHGLFLPSTLSEYHDGDPNT